MRAENETNESPWTLLYLSSRLFNCVTQAHYTQSYLVS